MYTPRRIHLARIAAHRGVQASAATLTVVASFLARSDVAALASGWARR